MKLSFILMFCSNISLAEYRAYELLITNVDSGKSVTVNSTMDQYQYVGYHNLNPGEKIEYVTSWMCFGRTGNFSAICAKPELTPKPVVNPVSPGQRDPAL